ncbi:Bax inhibitor 1 [Branchiostoma belcheri]|nr:Bax inhibitor 1 [Branchiostoma belcheri]
MDQHKQTGQGKSQAIAACKTNTTADALVSGHGQTGYQVINELLDTEGHLYNTEQTALNSTTEPLQTKTSLYDTGPDASYSKLVESQYQGLIKSTTAEMTSGGSQTITESNTNTTPTVVTGGNGQIEQCQSQAITQSLDIGNLPRDALLAALQPNPIYVGVKQPASTEIASGHDQTGQGQSQAIFESNTNTTALVTCGDDQTGQGQSQAITESNTNTTALATCGHDQVLDMINPMCAALLAALQTNPMYVDVKIPASTEIGSGHNQLLQDQSQTNTESNTNTTATVVAGGNVRSDQGQSLDIINLFRDALFAALQSNPMYVDVETPPENTASADIASGHDQTGQGQSQANTQSFDIGNLPRDALLAALQPNLMYESAKTPPKDQTSTGIASGHDQTGQGQSQTITESNRNTTATAMTSGHDQTGQGQYQTITESNRNTTATVMTSGHDQAGQGQYQPLIKPNTNTIG